MPHELLSVKYSSILVRMPSALSVVQQMAA
jgi:hypothetical protein